MSTYDAARRRQGVRKGRERGVWLFVPAVELEAAGIDPKAPPPFYRLWARAGRLLAVRFYLEP